jgi:NDP-sugar pyrophosphorylase family protein
VVNVIKNFRKQNRICLLMAMMAGGRGQRLQPENTTMKPLLKVGIGYYGTQLTDWLYLGLMILDFCKIFREQIEAHLQGKEKNLKIEYVWENEPLELLVRSQIKNLEYYSM